MSPAEGVAEAARGRVTWLGLAVGAADNHGAASRERACSGESRGPSAAAVFSLWRPERGGDFPLCIPFLLVNLTNINDGAIV
ncbi:hypothetical protein C5O22_06170 [Treponema sp. J25]|nr:hypothetical protein C5O22_06170 [Treponema sp. J25]